MDSIDWDKQWEAFAEGYRDGYAHIDLSTYGGPSKTLKIKAGAGFGDLSHPTTKMALQLLLPKAPSQTLVDIGTGSGILALAAHAAGASVIYALEIEPASIEHAKVNFQSAPSIQLVKSAPTGLSNPLIVMNMTYLEQLQALEQYAPLFQGPYTLITSGILTTQRKEYLSHFEKCTLLSELSSDGWCAFFLQAL